MKIHHNTIFKEYLNLEYNGTWPGQKFYPRQISLAFVDTVYPRNESDNLQMIKF